MNYVRVKSYAKINLTLDIVGAEGGYHMIDSVVASIDIYDLICAKRRRDKFVSVEMHGQGSEKIPPESNNAVRAAESFCKRFGTDGADITVWKNIPVGAGLGGSSADVAGVLNAMAKLYGVDDKEAIKQIADELGSDCGYMLTGGFARISGRGDIVKRLYSGGNLNLDIGLLLPPSGVSTAACYALSDKLNAERAPGTGSAAAENAIEAGDKSALGASLTNGLFKAAASLNPDVKKAYEELKGFDPSGVNLTGSGSGVYAIFQNDEFARYAKSRYRGKFLFVLTKTVVPSKEEKDG